MMKLINLICIAVILASTCQAEQPTADPTSEHAADDLIMKRIDLAKLSQIRMETRGFDMATKCRLFEDELRRTVGDHFGHGVSRNDLFAGVSRVLSRRKLPFGNSQPALKEIEDCLTVPESDIVAHPDTTRQVIAGPPVTESATVTESSGRQAMDQAMNEFRGVKDRVKDFGLDLYATGRGADSVSPDDGGRHDALSQENHQGEQSVHGDTHDNKSAHQLELQSDGVHHETTGNPTTELESNAPLDEHHVISGEADIHHEGSIGGLTEHRGEPVQGLDDQPADHSPYELNYQGRSLEHGNFVDDHGTLNIKVHDDSHEEDDNIVPVHDARLHDHGDSSSYDSSGLMAGPHGSFDDNEAESELHPDNRDSTDQNLDQLAMIEELRNAAEQLADKDALLQEKDDIIADLHQRLNDLDLKLTSVSETSRLIERSRFELLKNQLEEANEREQELVKNLEEARAELREKEHLIERLAEQLNEVLPAIKTEDHDHESTDHSNGDADDSNDDDDQDDDETHTSGHRLEYQNQELNDIAKMAKKLAEKMEKSMDSLEGRCNKYYLVFSPGHKLTKDEVKRIAKKNLNGATVNYDLRNINRLRHVGMLLARNQKRSVQRIGHEMQQCFSGHQLGSRHSSMGQWHSAGGHFVSANSHGVVLQHDGSASRPIPHFPPMPPMPPMPRMF